MQKEVIFKARKDPRSVTLSCILMDRLMLMDIEIICARPPWEL